MTVFFRLGYRLIEDVSGVFIAAFEINQTVRVGPIVDFHTSVLFVSIIDGEPYRDCLRWRQGPIAAVLVPINTLAVSR